MADLRFDGVTLQKGDVALLDDVSFHIADGTMVSIIGPSGSGKTSILKVTAGLLKPTEGSIWIGGDDYTDTKPQERDLAMVFQSAVTYPRRRIRRQIAYPLEMRDVAEPERTNRVKAEANTVGIGDLLQRKPKTVSAGQRQLMQIARALVRSPQVFLMDEPFHNLDAHLRGEIRREIQLLQRGYGVTTVVTTNDPQAAMAVGEELLVVDEGRLIQHNSTQRVFEAPINLMTAHLLGEMNLIPVRVETDRDGAWLVADGIRLRAWRPELRSMNGASVHLGVRPTWLREDPNGALRGMVDSQVGVGMTAQYQVRLGGVGVTIRGMARPGAEMRLRATNAVVFGHDGVAIAPIP